ncbi:hypothetical protein FRACYDRAFT_154427, partial [Fragilariopsis cylindrus CCMP1102]
MTVHSFHIFDRRGKTLFTKRYNDDEAAAEEEEEERLSEQRKLVFGMLYSLRELSSSLSPVDGPGDLQFMKTGASNVYNYETVSGLRFVLYTTNNDNITSSRQPINNTNTNIRSSLKYIYEHIWVAYVIRSPMYQP